MIEPTGDWAQTIAHLLALADRLEGHGQYNIAKLARAAADSLARRAAYTLNLPHDPDEVLSDLNHLRFALSGFGLGEDFVAALGRGAAAMSDGRLPLIDETPTPYVCRTCGALVMTRPQAPCAECGAWPATFRQFKPVYWLDELQPADSLAQLGDTPERVAELLAGLSEDHLARPGADGGWSMRQVVAHLRDAEGVLNGRLRLMAARDNPVLESLAVFAWATSEENRPPTTAEIFRTYRDSRNQSLEILRGLSPEDWQRAGQHKEFGPVTIRQQASYFSAHEQTHLAALVALRQAPEA